MMMDHQSVEDLNVATMCGLDNSFMWDVQKRAIKLIPIQFSIHFEEIHFSDTISWNIYEEAFTPDEFAIAMAENLGIENNFQFIPAASKSIRTQIDSFVAKNFDVTEEMLPNPKYMNYTFLLKLNIKVQDKLIAEEFEYPLFPTKAESPHMFAWNFCLQVEINPEIYFQIIFHSFLKQICVARLNFDKDFFKDEKKKNNLIFDLNGDFIDNAYKKININLPGAEDLNEYLKSINNNIASPIYVNDTYFVEYTCGQSSFGHGNYTYSLPPLAPHSFNESKLFSGQAPYSQNYLPLLDLTDQMVAPAAEPFLINNNKNKKNVVSSNTSNKVNSQQKTKKKSNSSSNNIQKKPNMTVEPDPALLAAQIKLINTNRRLIENCNNSKNLQSSDGSQNLKRKLESHPNAFNSVKKHRGFGASAKMFNEDCSMDFSESRKNWKCDWCLLSGVFTPTLRKGPLGAKTLCNACGIWFVKRGSLPPERYQESYPERESNLTTVS
ncbi:Snf5- protein 1 [Clydaea vesicula]|uniref:Snf5- protein 1 n=1 Tax=Clydaea vesicula TaxID=447962 RepID=A0AAD5U2T3_9FUNG|nr:Snf5- protein 1 [Clydaea vesicula]KAJ3389555.1 Snf5- protein 1 [Lobulomyces angularis]